MANMGARHTRLRFFPAPAQDDGTVVDVMEVSDLTHPIFNNIISAGNTIDIAAPGIALKPLLTQLNAGNGQLLAVTSLAKYVLVAEWDAQQPYYEGSVDVLHGKRMVYFNTQGSNMTTLPLPYTSNISENGYKLLLNIAEYMITGDVVVAANEAPSDILLSNAVIDEEQPIGSVVGNLTAMDEIGSTLTYSLVAGDGVNDVDNAKFVIEGDALKNNAILDFETKSTYSIFVEVSDGEFTFTKALEITLNDLVLPSIAWLGNNIASDELYIQNLRESGYEVFNETDEKGNLTQTQIDLLNSYDLVILSRGLNSADYNYPADYDSITTPFLCMANMAARNSRLRFFPAPASNDPIDIIDVLEVSDVTHPIFNNIGLSATKTIEIAAPGVIIKPLIDQFSAGNGNLLGVNLINKYVLVAEWDAQEPYYEGSVDILHGKRMVYFNTQGSNPAGDLNTSYLSDNGYKLLTNIAEYMITGAVVDLNVAPSELLLSNTIIDENLPIGSEVGILSATDENEGAFFEYSLVAGDGTNDADNAMFIVEGDVLKTNAVLDFETQSSYAINLQVSDGKLTYTQAFDITLNDLGGEVGVGELSNDGIIVFPNPIVDALYIKSGKDVDAKVSISSLTGQVVYNNVHSLGNVVEVKLQLSAGVYILNIEGENLQYTNRIVVIKK
jgi:hypothetical protein